MDQGAQLGAVVGLGQRGVFPAANLVQLAFELDAACIANGAQLGHALGSHLRPQLRREAQAFLDQGIRERCRIKHAKQADQIEIAALDLAGERCKLRIAHGARQGEAKEVAVGVGDGDLGEILAFRRGLIGSDRSPLQGHRREQEASGE